MLTDSNFKEAKTAYLIGTYSSRQSKEESQESVNELKRLGETYGLTEVGREVCPLRKIESSTFLGQGKLDEILLALEETLAEVVIFDEEITPNQQRNLEKFFKRPVIDRSELIIEVFAQRAQTKEARLQVDLAKSKYLMPRLKRMWTHLSRQRGGGGGGGSGGYLRGAGELQIEVDRQLVKTRIQQLQEEIEVVQKNRQTQRQKRVRLSVPSFAIVGYTNAGKSSLLNKLTESSVFVEDKLFATLDTTTRHYTLPTHQEVVLIDTVGFIKKIPHTLITAFKSTLEEALCTDVLIHLIDVSNKLAPIEAKTTMDVLKELGAASQRMITLFSKVDKVEDKASYEELRCMYPEAIEISSLTGQGLDHLLEKMVEEVKNLRKTVTLRIPQSEYALVTLLMREGHVIESNYEENDVIITVDVPLRLEYKIKPFLVL
ncbi:GTPase HflX [Rhabdochlamydiaceae symbiont of Dictyostelium giganteum]|uniref:GTPase HflX n=1 Tax=Rhabdochlamydiaceae symbiont of Dictyostelium giganteum TaxID=3342349 RepID=UPI00384F4938